jgi:HEAT repeat protein
MLPVAAADALCRIGEYDQAVPLLAQRLDDPQEWVRLYAINALDRLDEKARDVLPRMQKSLQDKNQYVVRVAEHALQELRAKKSP